MTTKPSDDLGPDSGAYVLHALSDAENARFEEELAGSEEARAEVTELADTAVELGLSIAPEDPPAALRARILDQLATTPQLGPVDGPAVAAAASSAPAESAPAAPVRPAGPAEERARRRWSTRPISAIIAVAAAAALIFGGGIAVNAVIQGQQASATAAQIGSIQAATDYRRATVTTDDASATLIWAESLKRSALVVHGMPALPGGKTYELWYIDKKGATPAGTFDASDSTQSIVLAGDMKAGDSVGVTIEPAGGSKTPTTKPVMVVSTA